MSAPASSSEEYGHYEIEYELGHGAMGTVYLARDRRIGRRVALKTINVSQRQFEDSSSAQAYFDRLQREAEVCGSLSHRNIVTLYETGYRDGRIAYLAIEYVEGETLQQTIKRHLPDALPVDFVIRVAMDVLRGLSYAHSHGVIHRDIKPANVLVGPDGVAKIADFGIARPQNSSLTKAGAMMGTPNYMPPEQILGQPLIPRADVFSTGVMLYEMLTGIKPFAGADVTVVLHNILRETPPRVVDINASVPRELSDIVEAMMAKRPEERPDAEETLKRMESVANIDTLALAKAIAPTRGWNRAIEKRLAVAIIAAVLVAAVLPIVMIGSAIDSTPTVTISPEKLREFEAKRTAITEAHGLLAAGRYTDSIGRYDAYLKNHPHSAAAREGKQVAEQLLKQQKARSAKKPAQRRKTQPEEDISPSELLNRLKKVFRNK